MSMSNAPICVDCSLEMRPKHNGVTLEEMADFGSYRLVQADVWACPNCGFEVISGIGKKPVAEHFQDGYNKRVADLPRPRYQSWANLEEKKRFEVSQ